MRTSHWFNNTIPASVSGAELKDLSFAALVKGVVDEQDASLLTTHPSYSKLNNVQHGYNRVAPITRPPLAFGLAC